MRRRPSWCLPLLSPYALQRVANLIGGQCRQFCVRDRNDSFAALLQFHWSCGNLDLEASVARDYLQWLASFQAQDQPQRFGYYDSTGSINGGFHGTKNGIKMVETQRTVLDSLRKEGALVIA